MSVEVKTVEGRFVASELKLLFTLGGSSYFRSAVFWEPIGKGDRFLVLRGMPVTEKGNRIPVLIHWKEALRARP